MFFIICLFSQKEEGIRLKVHFKVRKQATNRAAVEEMQKLIIVVFVVMVNILFNVN